MNRGAQRDPRQGPTRPRTRRSAELAYPFNNTRRAALREQQSTLTYAGSVSDINVSCYRAGPPSFPTNQQKATGRVFNTWTVPLIVQSQALSVLDVRMSQSFSGWPCSMPATCNLGRRARAHGRAVGTQASPHPHRCGRRSRFKSSRPDVHNSLLSSMTPNAGPHRGVCLIGRNSMSDFLRQCRRLPAYLGRVVAFTRKTRRTALLELLTVCGSKSRVAEGSPATDNTRVAVCCHSPG